MIPPSNKKINMSNCLAKIKLNGRISLIEISGKISMEVDWIRSILGGGLISLSLGLFIILNARTVGLADMLKNVLERKPSRFWNDQLLFIIGILVSPVIFSATFYPVATNNLAENPVVYVLAGFFVGSGAQLCRGGPIKITVSGWIVNVRQSVSLLLVIIFSGFLTQILFTYFGVNYS